MTHSLNSSHPRPSRKNIEWTGAVISFIFLLFIYVLMGREDGQSMRVKESDVPAHISYDSRQKELIYADAHVRVFLAPSGSVEESMKHDTAYTPISRSYTQTENGIVIIEGDLNSENAQTILHTLKETSP